MFGIFVEIGKAMKEIMGKVWGPNLKREKACDYLQVCLWVIPKMEYLI